MKKLTVVALQDQSIEALVVDLDSAQVIRDVDQFLEAWHKAAPWPEYYGIATHRHRWAEMKAALKLAAVGGRIIPDSEFPEAWGRIARQAAIPRVDLKIGDDVLAAASALGLKLSGRVSIAEALKHIRVSPSEKVQRWRDQDRAGQRPASDMECIAQLLKLSYLRQEGWEWPAIAIVCGALTKKHLTRNLARRLHITTDQLKSLSYRDVLMDLTAGVLHYDSLTSQPHVPLLEWDVVGKFLTRARV